MPIVAYKNPSLINDVKKEANSEDLKDLKNEWKTSNQADDSEDNEKKITAPKSLPPLRLNSMTERLSVKTVEVGEAGTSAEKADTVTENASDDSKGKEITLVDS